MRRCTRWFPLALVAALQLVPVGSATHLADVRLTLPPAPDVPESPIASPGIPPVDRRVGEVSGILHDANETLEERYETVNQTYRGADRSRPSQPLQIYFDGAGQTETGPDASIGGQRDWRVVGDAAWTRSSTAARTGNVGLAMERRPDGTYAGAAHGMLLSPVLDVASGFVDPALRSSYNLLAPVIGNLDATIQSGVGEEHLSAKNLLMVSGVYSALWYELQYRVFTGPESPNCGGGPGRPCWSTGLRAEDPGAALYQLEFWARFNLAQGEDFVQTYVFTGAEPPKEAPTPLTCPTMSAPSCTRVYPVEGYSHGGPTSVGDPSEAFTGTGGWEAYHLDLTRWAETSQPVWVGFVVDTANYASPKRFQNPALFAEGVGFFGFQIDDLRLTVPSPPGNVRVRVPHEPSFKFVGQSEPSVRPNETFFVAGDIVNTGQNTVAVRPTVIVREVVNRTVVFEEKLPRSDLTPGALLHIVKSIGGLPEGQYLVRILAGRMPSGQPLGNPEADTSDDLATLVFRVQEISNVEFGPLLLPAKTMNRGDTLGVATTVTNHGTEPTTVTLVADVVNVPDRTLVPDSAGMIVTNQQIQTQVIPSLGSADFRWDVKGTTVGQFRLFVREATATPFRSSDLEDPLRPTIRPQFRPDERPLDLPAYNESFLLSRDRWLNVPTVPIPITVSQARPTIQAINSNSTLFIAVTHRECKPGCSDFGGVEAGYFDDGADRVAVHGGEDGFTATSMALNHQRWNGTTLQWERDGLSSGWVSAKTDTGLKETMVVFARPINSTRQGELHSGPGEIAGFMLQLRSDNKEYEYPPGATTVDGNSFVPANKDISDEMAAWARIELSEYGDHAPSGRRFLSGSFGVDKAAPPIYAADFSDCAATAGWSYSSRFKATGLPSWATNADAWNCAPYSPDGQVHMFSGQRPGSCSEGERCDPFTVAGGSSPGAGTNNIKHVNLYSPPITIDAASAPYLHVLHEYGSKTGVDSGSSIPAIPTRYITTPQNYRVLVQILDPSTNAWGQDILLEPTGGYDTEETAGVFDSLAGPRQIVGTHDSDDGDDDLNECTTLAVDTRGASNPNPRCGWWTPTGAMPFQKFTDQAMLGRVYNGSGWRRDVVPLFGQPFGDSAVADVAGATIRLVFSAGLTGGPEPLYEVPTPEYGWRIAGIVVGEEDKGIRDLAVHKVTLGPTSYNVTTLGLGPGTPVPVNVTVANLGKVKEPSIAVAVRGADVETGAPLCEMLTASVVPLDVGETRELTIPCKLPSTPGVGVRFSAAVASTVPDDFPPDNIRSTREFYALRSAPSLGVVLDSSARTGRAQTDRQIDLVVANTGNQPVSGFTVRRTIELKGDNGETQLMDADVWNFQGTLDVGERHGLLDAALAPSEAIAPGDMHFNPPSPGLYEVVATVDYADDRILVDNAARLALHADLELYADDFDHSRTADSGIVPIGSVPVPSNPTWTTANAGFLGTKTLFAGDPSTGEIAVQTDANYTLPLMHLATAKSVSLTLSQRYELEAMYDGGRVELSVDSGKTWRPLIPDANPIAGRPHGYPDLPIVGLNPLTAGDSSQSALAFSGSSIDFADAVDGWTRLVFDLGQAPELRRPAEFDHFDLAGFQTSPSIVTDRDGRLQVRDQSWELEEPAAFANERYWWVENVAPRPVSGTNMWWSGSFGEVPGTPVNTKLALRMATPPPVASDERPLFLRWWDWRTGGVDSLDPLGVVGGDLKVTLFEPDADDDGLPDWLELRSVGTDWQDADTDNDNFEDGVEIHSAKDPLDASSKPTLISGSSGLTQEWLDRMAAIGQGLTPAQISNGDPDGDGLINRLEMEWGTLPKTADSDGDGVKDGAEVTQGTNPNFAQVVETELVREDGWTLHRTDASRSWGAVLAEFAYASSTSTFANRTLNLGVFIDDVHVVQAKVSPLGELVDPSVVGFDDLEVEGWENWTVTATGTTKWSIAKSELGKRDPGWSVSSLVGVPGAGPSIPWHFTAANEQGYPHRVDARLVTPVVDLRSVQSNDATLRFDHRYDFETTTTPNSRTCTSACFTIAVDGGAVEYQIQDPSTEEFGPWMQLGAGELPEGLLFLRDTTFPPADNGIDQFWDEDQAERLRQSGYTALSLREPGRVIQQCEDQPASFGYSFQRFVGYASASGGCPWLERPYSVVFSGSSGGWNHEEWSVSHLAGYKVRFAFHVATNPAHVSDGYARLGWQVANVAVAGSVFSGRDAQVRFRVGTDASITKGFWAIDDISIIGDLYERLAVLGPSSPSRAKASPESFVDFFANITNYGRDPRSNLVLAIGGLSASQFDVVSPAPGTSTIPSSELPPGFSVGFGPIQLFGGGQPGSRVPVHVRVRSPAENEVANLRLALLEHNGTAYTTPANDVPGTVSDVWRVEGFTSTLLAAIPPTLAEPALIRMEPRTADVGAAVTFTSRIQNSGSTQPVVAAAWTLDEIQSKGNPDDQPKTRETKVPEASHVDDLGTIRPLESRESKATFTPQKAGLYRATVTFLANGKPNGDPESIEFLVGIPGNYHLTDFAIDNATARGWRDDSPSPEERSGGTPPELRFRQAGTQFLWGVSDDQLRQSYDYCSFGGCNFPVQSQASTVAGLEGVGKGPIIDLSRVPGDEAALSIRHGFAFTSPGDGARLEVLPYDPDTLDTPFPAPAFFCEDAQGNQFPERFILEPDDPLQGLATSTDARARRLSGSNSFVPQRMNVLAGPPPANVPVFGGPVVVEQTDRYPLSQTPTPACENPLFEPGEGFNLLNYPIQLVLHTGTQAGVNPGQGTQNMQRTGSVGWRIFAVSVSSVDLDVEPRELRIPLIDGIQKDFQIRITNRGQVADRLQVTVDPNRTTLPNPSWVQVPSPEVELGPGESAQVPYRLEIPTAEALSRGTYVASLLVRSLVDPNAYQHVTNTIMLLPNPLPDLGLTLALGSTDIEGTVEEGTVIPVFATVFNQGLADAAAVRLTLSVHDIVDGTDIDLGSVDVPELCADARARSGLCAGPSTAPLFFEWPTPLKSGPYRLTARLDPEARLNEESVDNNVATLDATVVPIRRPDIAIQTITIDAGPDGIADEGELLKLTATLRNLGSASASGVNVQISMGSTPLLDRRFDVVPAQFSINLTATVLAPAGDFVVKAITFTDSAGLPDANPSNNEFKRILRVRSHELLAEASASVTGLPGQTVQARVTLTNTGNTLEDVVGGLDPALASQGWTIGLAPMPFLLPPGSMADAAVSLRIPDNASAGVHRVTVRFSDQRSQQPLADAIILADILRIDAEPTIALVNATIAPGQHALRFVAKSHSNANENVTLRLTTPAWGDRSNRTLLPAHDNVTIGLKVDIPGTAPPGLHNLSVQLVGDSARVLARAVLPLRIEPKLGSSFRWVSGERVDAAEPGNQVLRLEATVENTGNVPFSFELVSPIPGSSPATGYVETVPLEPGAARRTTWNLPLPAHIDAHALEPVQALVHFQTNKTALAAVLPIPSLETLANLVATEPIVRPLQDLRPRDPLNVDFLVGNRGARATAGGRVLAYIDGVLADMAPLPPIGAGQEHATTFHWSAPGPGDHLLLFVVEATNQTPESTVADNSASLPIHVGEAAPLDKVLHAVPNAATPTLLAAIAAAAFVAHRRRRG